MASFTYQQGLGDILRRYAPDIDEGLVSVLGAIGLSSGAIGQHLKLASGASKAGTDNAFGDEQLDVDLAADKIIFDEFKRCGAVGVAASEEKPVEDPMGGSSEKLYSVGFDPLDGSSIIDANFAVGSIFGVWPGNKLLGRTGREQVASCMSQYGPRTTMAVALAASTTGGDAVAFEVTFQPDSNRWVVTREKFDIAPSGKVFAPGNLRATADQPAYKRLFEHWVDNRYQLRYTGGMVPDVYHILIKNKGVFSNVASAAAKAKLRLLYECAPIALLIEAAGGASVVGPAPGAAPGETPRSVLDVEIDNLDKRLGLCLGGKEEVAVFNSFMFDPPGGRRASEPAVVLAAFATEGGVAPRPSEPSRMSYFAGTQVYRFSPTAAARLETAPAMQGFMFSASGEPRQDRGNGLSAAPGNGADQREADSRSVGGGAGKRESEDRT
eukprot:g1953.t1